MDTDPKNDRSEVESEATEPETPDETAPGIASVMDQLRTRTEHDRRQRQQGRIGG